MADYIFLLQYFTDDTGVCSHVCAPVLWRNSYPPETVHQCCQKCTPFDAQLTRFYIRVIRVRDVKWSAWQQLTYLIYISFGEWVSYMITLSLAGLTTSKNNILQSLVMMDKYNLQCLQTWFAHNKIKHEKFYARQFPEDYFRISLNCCDMH